MFLECQTDFIDNSVIIANLQKEAAALRLALSSRSEFTIETLLKGNDKLARYYTGFPTYNSFMAFSDYLEPKAQKMILALTLQL